MIFPEMDQDRQLANPPIYTEDEDSEWEYEYDETETEVRHLIQLRTLSTKHDQSFYVTLDISSTSHQTRAPKKKAPPKEVNPTHSEEQAKNRAANEETLAIDPAIQDATSSLNGSNPIPSVPSDSQERIQILDLHTQNPLISYHNRIYSCTWGSTLGTDVFLASPNSMSAISNKTTIAPLLNLPEVSVLGTSCINLTARLVTIVPKADDPQPQQSAPAPAAPIDTQATPVSATNHETDPVPAQPPTSPKPAPLQIPLSDSAPSSRRTQASFLESLMAIKTAKGESDQVTVHATKSYQGTGWRARKRFQEAAQAAGMVDEQGNLVTDNRTSNGDINMGDTVVAVAGTVEPHEQDTNAQAVAPSPAKRARARDRDRGDSARRIGRPKGGRARGRVRIGKRPAARDPEVGDEAGTGNADKTPARWEEVTSRAQEGTDGNGDETADDEADPRRGVAAEGDEGEGGWKGGEEGDVAMGEEEQDS